MIMETYGGSWLHALTYICCQKLCRSWRWWWNQLVIHMRFFSKEDQFSMQQMILNSTSKILKSVTSLSHNHLLEDFVFFWDTKHMIVSSQGKIQIQKPIYAKRVCSDRSKMRKVHWDIEYLPWLQQWNSYFVSFELSQFSYIKQYELA